MRARRQVDLHGAQDEQPRHAGHVLAQHGALLLSLPRGCAACCGNAAPLRRRRCVARAPLRRLPVARCATRLARPNPKPARFLPPQLLALIGEQFPDPGEICGAVVNVRNKGDRISIWTRTGGNEAAQMAVGKCMKSVLDLNETTRLGYMLHDDAIKLDRKAKDRYTV